MTASRPPTWHPVSDKVLDAWAYILDQMHVAATQANERFQKRTAELKDHFARHPQKYADETTRRNKLIDDYELRNALDDYAFAVGEEQRMAARITAEYQLRQMHAKSRSRQL